MTTEPLIAWVGSDMKIYGIAEIAEILDARPETVAQWRQRGKLPEPDEELAMGPAWLAETIEPWIRKASAEARP